MKYNRAVNVMGFAYHYFTIMPGFFEARVFIFIKEIRPAGRISSTEKDCRTNLLVRQPHLTLRYNYQILRMIFHVSQHLVGFEKPVKIQ